MGRPPAASVRPPSRMTALIAALVMVASLLVAGAPRAEADHRESPPQYPHVCTTARQGLGQPLVDNQEAEGIPVAAEDENGEYPSDARGYPTDEAEIVGWSRDCEVETQHSYLYRVEGGGFAPLDDPADLPADIAMTTTTEGVTVPFIVRLERGTINRFIYSIAMLAPEGEEDPAAPDTSLWNRRAVFSFSGGVAIGHTQGDWSQGAALLDHQLQRGYAVLYSTGTRTNTHYNLVRGGQTAAMVKDRLIEGYGEPDYTVAVGGSGGAIQQYVYAQNHPGLLDGGVPQQSYPDMVTQTIHIGDCELLEHYMERTDAANPRWRDITERPKLVGLNAEQDPQVGSSDRAQFNQIYQLYSMFGVPTPDGWQPDGSVVPLTECRPGWFGLLPLAMNPTFTNVRDIEQIAQGVADVEWTHWDDAADVYGRDDDGWARTTWDNVGVQYGLQALRDGGITPQEFLDVNAYVGGWKHTSEMAPEGCPFVQSLCGDPTQFDPWSSRNMHLSPGGTAPAPRTEGDVEAIRGAFAHGHVFRGALDIPMIDWRPYLEHQLDMHNVHQSFAVRQRMVRAQGHHDNQLIWFADARPTPAPGTVVPQITMALDVLHEWITNIRENPAAGVGANRPDGAADGCFATDGSLIHVGDDAWSGVLDSGPAGPCTARFELHSTSRIQAGGPIAGDVFKCATMPVRTAVAQGVYAPWEPSEEEIARLEEIHPEGVCDYRLPGVGEPGTDPVIPPGPGPGLPPPVEPPVGRPPFVPPPVVPGPGVPGPGEVVSRLSGANRLETAVAISREGFGDGAASVVVLARADVAPDALAGTPLAFARGGPLLLTSSSALVEVVAEEIVRVLGPGGTVVLLGGEAALDPAVEVALQGLGFATERIAGASRVETSVAVARALGGLGDGVAAALVSTGDTFADALPAGAAAARVGGAVLLVHGDRPHAAVSAYLAEHAGVEVVAVGGPAGRAYPEAQPLVGATREDTAVAVAARFFPDAEVVGIARRDDFPDALAGGAHMAVRGGPVLLTPTAALHPSVGAHLCTSDTIEAAVVYGGTAAISPATADAIAAAITRDGC